MYGDVYGVYGDVQGCMVIYKGLWCCMGVYSDVHMAYGMAYGVYGDVQGCMVKYGDVW